MAACYLRGVKALLAASLLTLAGCFEALDGGACTRDSDCPGAVCTRVGECATQAYALRVTWTIDGVAASDTACAGVSELELSVIDPSTGTSHTIRPVPCAAGSFFFDKLPLGYTDVQLWSFGLSGERLTFASGTAVGSGGVVAIDL